MWWRMDLLGAQRLGDDVRDAGVRPLGADGAELLGPPPQLVLLRRLVQGDHPAEHDAHARQHLQRTRS